MFAIATVGLCLVTVAPVCNDIINAVREIMRLLQDFARDMISWFKPWYYVVQEITPCAVWYHDGIYCYDRYDFIVLQWNHAVYQIMHRIIVFEILYIIEVMKYITGFNIDRRSLLRVVINQF